MLLVLSAWKTVSVHIDHQMQFFRLIEIGCPRKTLKNSISSSWWDQHGLLTTTLKPKIGLEIDFFHRKSGHACVDGLHNHSARSCCALSTGLTGKAGKRQEDVAKDMQSVTVQQDEIG
jgi:hypothetical protein